MPEVHINKTCMTNSTGLVHHGMYKSFPRASCMFGGSDKCLLGSVGCIPKVGLSDCQTVRLSKVVAWGGGGRKEGE